MGPQWRVQADDQGQAQGAALGNSGGGGGAQAADVRVGGAAQSGEHDRSRTPTPAGMRFHTDGGVSQEMAALERQRAELERKKQEEQAGAQTVVVRRADGEGSTLLRKVATTSREAGVWTDPPTAVMSGEEVQVLRHEAETGFAWVRAASGAEGYLNASYFLSTEQRAFVGRSDGDGGTMLRKIATTSREPEVFVESRAVVRDGEEVAVIRYQPDFCWVRAPSGDEGLIQTDYLSCAVVSRSDSVGGTLLRKIASTSQAGDAYTTPRVEVKDGTRVQMLRTERSSDGVEFQFVRVAGGAEGFLRKDYVHALVRISVGFLRAACHDD